jgi:hypothetical protein
LLATVVLNQTEAQSSDQKWISCRGYFYTFLELSFFGDSENMFELFGFYLWKKNITHDEFWGLSLGGFFKIF